MPRSDIASRANVTIDRLKALRRRLAPPPAASEPSGQASPAPGDLATPPPSPHEPNEEHRPPPESLLTTRPDLEADFVTPYAAALPYTLTSAERMYALWRATRYVATQGIPGAFVECGVWRGGSMMLAALTLLAADQSDRELWLYDTFTGMSPPTAEDVDFTGVTAQEHLRRAAGDFANPIWGIASLEEVQANMASTAYPSQRVVYVQGPVEETIPDRVPDQIALLRLDTDWESSTRHELEHLWSRLSPGGVLIADDYGHWQGARRAVDEYFAGRDDAPLLTRVDYSGRVAIKWN